MRSSPWAACALLSCMGASCNLIAGVDGFGPDPAGTGGAGTTDSTTTTATTTTGGGGGGAAVGGGGAGGSAGACNDGVKEPTEECDTADLGGKYCTDLPGYDGGTLGCTVACLFDTTGCTATVTVPQNRLPQNGAYVGSLFLPGSRKPRFLWEAASTTPPGGAIDYELQYSVDPNLVNGTTTVTIPVLTEHVPALDLPAQTAAFPKGSRYFWHVRACLQGTSQCSPYSPTWSFQLGRQRSDFNGDGYADILASTLIGNGEVRLVRGSASLGAVLVSNGNAFGEAAADWFGYAVASAGDVNADGYADVVVGAPQNDASGNQYGRVYLYFGATLGPFNQPASIVHTSPGPDYNRTGWCVAGAGDMNGDGADEFAKGSRFWGCAHVLVGGAMADGILDASIAGVNVAPGGDINGDGYADLLASRPFDSAGSVRIAYGNPSVTGANCGAGALLVGGKSDDGLGQTMASGDLDADGFSDFAAGASDPAWSGYVNILMGSKPGPTAGQVATIAGGGKFGSSVAMGDVNGDGYDDLLVGSPGADRVEMFFGGAGPLDQNVDASLFDPGPLSDTFGFVAVPGDVDGDGIDDIVVAAPGVNAGAGAAYLYKGGTFALIGTLSGAAGEGLGQSIGP